jgi:hypothetical protein
VLPAAEYQISAGDRGEPGILWMQALGTDAVIVPDQTSPEHYHDYVTPYKFRGLAPVLNDDGHGTVIYRIPRIYAGIGRVVDTSQIATIEPPPWADYVAALSRYVAVVENPAQSATAVTWKSFDEAELRAQVAAGQSILFQETFDPAWRAYENGRPIPIRKEPVMNFMLLDVPEGAHAVQLRFETPLENDIGRVISAFALAVIMVLIWRGYALRSTPSHPTAQEPRPFGSDQEPTNAERAEGAVDVGFSRDSKASGSSRRSMLLNRGRQQAVIVFTPRVPPSLSCSHRPVRAATRASEEACKP